VNKKIFFILIINTLLGFPDCDYGIPNWEELYELVPFDNEFNATISASQIFIDGIEMVDGKLAGFVNNEIRALDSDGSSYFPPGDTNIFELSLWSNQVSGELFSFKYYSQENNIVIDLVETYTFESNDIIGDAFNPLILNGSALDCEFEDLNHFSDVVDSTGVSQLIILSDTITELNEGDQIGIFDYNGLISEGEECLDLIGEVLVGYGEWQNSQLNIVAWSHIDFCDFNGPQLPGFIENNPIKIKVWDISEQLEYSPSFIISDGSSQFQETSFSVISDICNGEYDDCSVCNGGNSDQDCAGSCFGDAIVDDCGVCDGIGPNHQCWDGSMVCNPFDCPESELPTPNLFSFNQSLSQAFYFINNIYIDNIDLDNDDWLAAFNGDVCVGSRKWDTDLCTNNICDIGVMGYDGSDLTDGYMLINELPSFKIYDSSENIYYDAFSSENFSFENGGLFVIDNIVQTDYYCNNTPSCSGCMNENACNFNANALIEDTCYYLESDLLQPFNNEVILLDNLPNDSAINFEWSNINQSCYEGILNYNIQIFDSNNQIIVSQSTQENNIPISYSNLNINEGEINLYSWNILIDDIILSDVFSFSIDATMMNIIDNKIDNFKIYQNYPNPFNPITYIEFDNLNYSLLKINIYDINGNFVEELVNSFYSPGKYQVYWDGSNFSSGIYLYEFKVANQTIRKKMVLIK
jgi:hypothetical protein